MTDDIKISPGYWDNIQGLTRLIDALYSNDNPARIVGGAVRDTLRGVDFHDVDIATPLLPDIVIEKLNNAGIKTIPTGLQHGTITAISDNNRFEVTTLRKDIKSDGRHAKVAFNNDWREDAMRRDFTINALYADPKTGEVFDYFNGLDDVKNERVRFIGNAQDRIEEDHLRILRYFRFLARFENPKVDIPSLEACKTLSNRQMTLARERICDEIIKILATKDPLYAVHLLYDNGIFIPFLPEITSENITALGKVIEYEKAHAIAPSALRRLSALLQSTIDTAGKIASRLKFSNAMRKSLLVRLSISNIETKDCKKLAFLHGKETAVDLILLYANQNDIRPCLEIIQNWDIPTFNLKGGELIKRGLTAGPIVSQVLQHIKDEWIAQGFPKTDVLDKIITQAIKSHL